MSQWLRFDWVNTYNLLSKPADKIQPRDWEIEVYKDMKTLLIYTSVFYINWTKLRLRSAYDLLKLAKIIKTERLFKFDRNEMNIIS